MLKLHLASAWVRLGKHRKELLNKMEKVAEDFLTTEFNAGNYQEHRNDKISVSINTIKYRSLYKCWCPLVRNTLNTSLRPNLRFSSNLSNFFTMFLHNFTGAISPLILKICFENYTTGLLNISELWTISFHWVFGFLVDFLAVAFLPTVLLDLSSLVAAGWKSGSSDSAPENMKNLITCAGMWLNSLEGWGPSA